MDVKRYEPVHEDAMAADADGRFVTFADYAQLRALYEAAWGECEAGRKVEQCVNWGNLDDGADDMARHRSTVAAHDKLRKEAGL